MNQIIKFNVYHFLYFSSPLFHTNFFRFPCYILIRLSYRLCVGEIYRFLHYGPLNMKIICANKKYLKSISFSFYSSLESNKPFHPLPLTSHSNHSVISLFQFPSELRLNSNLSRGYLEVNYLNFSRSIFSDQSILAILTGVSFVSYDLASAWGGCSCMVTARHGQFSRSNKSISHRTSGNSYPCKQTCMVTIRLGPFNYQFKSSS